MQKQSWNLENYFSWFRNLWYCTYVVVVFFVFLCFFFMSIIDFPIQLQNKVFSFSAVCKTTWKTLNSAFILKCIVLELTSLKSLPPYEGALWRNYRKEYITVIRIIYQRKRVRSTLIWLYPKFAQLTYRILWLFRKFAQLTYRIPKFLTTKYAAILPEYTSSSSILVWLVLPNFCFYVEFCTSLFVFLSFLFWKLDCLSIFDLSLGILN